MLWLFRKHHFYHRWPCLPTAWFVWHRITAYIRDPSQLQPVVECQCHLFAEGQGCRVAYWWSVLVVCATMGMSFSISVRNLHTPCTFLLCSLLLGCISGFPSTYHRIQCRFYFLPDGPKNALRRLLIILNSILCSAQLTRRHERCCREREDFRVM